MGTSRGLDEFSRRMVVVADGIVRNVAQTIRKAALVVDQTAVLATPVDTGRARGGWVASTGAPSAGEDTSLDPSGQAALAQAAGVVADYKLDLGSIYIANNVVYIGVLDDGSSRQAPAGMTAQALVEGEKVIQAARVVPE